MRFLRRPCVWAVRLVLPFLLLLLLLPPTSTAQEPRGGGAIQVHGHWVIAIKGGGGEEISRHEFENALADPAAFVTLLQGGDVAVFGGWVVNVGPNLCDRPIPLSQPVPSDCSILPPRSAGAGPRPSNLFDTLTSVAPPQTHSFTLAGSAVAARDGQITSVSTQLTPCVLSPSSTSSTSACMAFRAGSWDILVGGHPFTARDLTAPSGNPPVTPPPIFVKKGQTIDVTVTLSFS